MIANTSTVSKATIYRRWASREDLIMQALSYLEFPKAIPDTGNVRDDLLALLKDLIDFLNKPDGGRVYSSFLNASVHDEKMDSFRRQLTMKAIVPYETVLKRSVDRGEIRLGMRMNLVIDLLIAPFVFRRIATNAPCRYGDAKAIVDFFVSACSVKRGTKAKRLAKIR
jgi:hypothetical protein